MDIERCGKRQNGGRVIFIKNCGLINFAVLKIKTNTMDGSGEVRVLKEFY